MDKVFKRKTGKSEDLHKYDEPKEIKASKKKEESSFEKANVINNIEDVNVANVINLGIPHVGEQIFDSININDLVKCLSVSMTWKILTENVLLKRCKVNILEACVAGETEIVKLLLNDQRGLTIINGLKDKDKFGQTAFLLACRNGHIDIVKQLLELPKKVGIKMRAMRYSTEEGFNARSSDGLTAFMWACRNGHINVVNLLLVEYPNWIILNAKDKSLQTAFMWACRNGHRDIVKQLLDFQVREMLENTGNRIFYFSTAIYQDFNARNNDGLTAFTWACRNGHMNVVNLLLEHPSCKRIDLNARDNSRQTAFMWACTNGHKDVVKVFLDRIRPGRRVEYFDAKNKFGRTPFMYACANGCVDVVKLLLNHQSCKQIDFNTKDNSGCNAFLWACSYGCKDVVQVLLQNSHIIDVRYPEINNFPPFIKDILKSWK